MESKSYRRIAPLSHAPLERLPQKVCMHITWPARTSVRLTRAATALIEAGLEVSAVDVENDSTRPMEEEVAGIPTRHIVMPGWSVPTQFKPWFLVKMARALVRRTSALVRSQADVYHAHDAPALFACFIAARLQRKPVIFEAYEMPWTAPYFRHGLHRRIMRRALLVLFRLIVPRCAGVIAVSPLHAHELRACFGGKTPVLVRNIPVYRAPSRSDRLRCQLGLSAGTHIALYQGYLHEDRGLPCLIHAARFLAPGIVIVVLGDGPMRLELEHLIEQEGVRNQVRVLPAVPQSELHEWTSSAELGLIVSPPGYSENVRVFLPNKLFEYLMAGVPVLTSPLQSVVDIVETYRVGHVLPSLEPEAVGRAISAMLADRAALARMRDNALAASARELRWDVEQQQLVALYGQIANGT